MISPLFPTIEHHALCLTFSNELLELTCELLKSSEIKTSSIITINCRSPSYSAESGGYRPQELAFKVLSEKSLLPLYVTEFTYVGGGYCPELVKALDFDFTSSVFQNEYGTAPLESMDELFQIWQQNFLSYFALGVYEVSISAC